MSSDETIEFSRTLQELNADVGMRVYSKDRKWTFLWVFLDGLLRILSFGKLTGFYTRFITTIGRNVFFPSGFQSRGATYGDCAILQHEAVHIRQYLALGCGNVWLGVLVMGLLYLFCPLPAGLAYFRYRFERVAYARGHLYRKKYGLSTDPEYYVELLSGPAYFWAWPRKYVARWFTKYCT